LSEILAGFSAKIGNAETKIMQGHIQFYKRKHNSSTWNLTLKSPICMDKPLKNDIFVQTQSIMQKAEILSKLKHSKTELNKFGVTRIGLFGFKHQLLS